MQSELHQEETDGAEVGTRKFLDIARSRATCHEPDSTAWSSEGEGHQVGLEENRADTTQSRSGIPNAKSTHGSESDNAGRIALQEHQLEEDPKRSRSLARSQESGSC